MNIKYNYILELQPSEEDLLKQLRIAGIRLRCLSITEVMRREIRETIDQMCLDELLNKYSL